jgi:hypothetical protein
MKAQILLGRSIMSLREETSSYLEALKAKKARCFNTLMRYYRTDTINPGPSADSILNMYIEEDGLSWKYKLVFEYMQLGDSINALNTLDSMPIYFNMDPEQLINQEVYEDFVEIIYNLENEGKSIFYPDSTSRAQLYNLYENSSGNIHEKLRNLLLATDTLVYNEPYFFPDLTKSAYSSEDYPDGINKQAPSFLYVHPNPAKDYVIVNYKNEKRRKGDVHIYNLKGNLMTNFKLLAKQGQRIIDVSNWKPGIYIVSLYIDSDMIESTKFTLVN